MTPLVVFTIGHSTRTIEDFIRLLRRTASNGSLTCARSRGRDTTDGEIGHLEDLLIDDHTWAIRYLIVNTSNWWGGHRVLRAGLITDVSWSEAKVSVDLTRQAVSD